MTKHWCRVCGFLAYVAWVLSFVILITFHFMQYSNDSNLTFKKTRNQRNFPDPDPDLGCYPTIPRVGGGLVCPHEGYMGFTNIVLNIAKCIQLASKVSTACGGGITLLFLPVRVQHGTIYDLFKPSVWEIFRNQYNVTIHFYCQDSNAALLKQQFPLLNVSSSNYVGSCLHHQRHHHVIRDAFTAYKGDDVSTTSQIVLTLMKHVASSPGLYAQTIMDKLIQHSHNNNNNGYTGMHLRFERDAWILFTSPHMSRFLSVEDKLVELDAELCKQMIPHREVWYGTGTTLRHAWSFALGNRKNVFLYKRELINERAVSTPFVAPSWRNKTVMIEVTNSTGALIDFLVVLHSKRAVVAKYSSFGQQIKALRCMFKFGETWIYTANMKVRRG
eukprot:PhF_6_TR4205/c0_g1_i1/m.5654